MFTVICSTAQYVMPEWRRVAQTAPTLAKWYGHDALVYEGYKLIAVYPAKLNTR